MLDVATVRGLFHKILAIASSQPIFKFNSGMKWATPSPLVKSCVEFNRIMVAVHPLTIQKDYIFAGNILRRKGC